ncbi:MAG: DoxX family protein [Gemmatimonadaceae bacterium]|nr:DoxX family protein [Gemmatimonadaceae bacterium]
MKIAGMPFMVDLFASLGFGQWLRYVTASVELGGGILLLTGRAQYLAALALAVIMVGATVASSVVFDRSPFPPLFTLIALLVIAWKRHPFAEGVPWQ